MNELRHELGIGAMKAPKTTVGAIVQDQLTGGKLALVSGQSR